MVNKIKRIERKWIFNSSNYLILINAVIRSNLFFRNQYPQRKVNSIYFDTNDYKSILQNLDGISGKKKIRIRWYGNEKIMTDPVIEIKSKNGFETKKEIIEIKELNNIQPFNLNVINEKLNAKLNLKKLVLPILTTNYDRQYFVSCDGKIRATVDYNLKSNFLKNLSQINIIKNFKKISILELKYPTSLDKYVRQNLKDISLRLTKNSKFVNSAMEKPKFIS